MISHRAEPEGAHVGFPTPLPQVSRSEHTNESYTWDYLRSQGFSKVHTAAIMGNLRQEHNYSTADVPGGLGIAQWMGDRRNKLLQKTEPFSIQTQVAYIVEELNSTESHAYRSLLATSIIEDATIAFQNKYERCHVNYCMPNQRIQYAHEAINKYGNEEVNES